MKDECDFSKGKRGKFFRKDAHSHLPVYLDDKVLAYLQAHAKAKGVGFNQLVNEMLKREIDLIEAVK